MTLRLSMTASSGSVVSVEVEWRLITAWGRTSSIFCSEQNPISFRGGLSAER
eukprot:CAMPEP_0170189330 /NCGR_PEP_ID=MMETSP0040_2-20121228/46588_1 /TAXON_ID=641309 /ORGANISM="Lotharella oceanica, Strain CCMP622" /LENGTH=51 /DNA_ID=CAMNT_0010436879 /DNA_START=48 /DNA_END=203 /DNA_ORIENTATION=-